MHSPTDSFNSFSSALLMPDPDIKSAGKPSPWSHRKGDSGYRTLSGPKTPVASPGEGGHGRHPSVGFLNSPKSIPEEGSYATYTDGGLTESPVPAGPPVFTGSPRLSNYPGVQSPSTGSDTSWTARGAFAGSPRLSRVLYSPQFGPESYQGRSVQPRRGDPHRTSLGFGPLLPNNPFSSNLHNSPVYHQRTPVPNISQGSRPVNITKRHPKEGRTRNSPGMTIVAPGFLPPSYPAPTSPLPQVPESTTASDCTQLIMSFPGTPRTPRIFDPRTHHGGNQPGSMIPSSGGVRTFSDPLPPLRGPPPTTPLPELLSLPPRSDISFPPESQCGIASARGSLEGKRAALLNKHFTSPTTASLSESGSLSGDAVTSPTSSANKRRAWYIMPDEPWNADEGSLQTTELTVPPATLSTVANQART